MPVPIRRVLPSVIRESSGGGADIPSYASLQAVVDAIGLEQLLEDERWAIPYNDSYYGEGVVTGIVKKSKPSWVGFLPISVLGSTTSVYNSAGTFTNTVNGDGHIVLTTGGTAGDRIELDLGIGFGNASCVTIECQLTQAAPSSSTTIDLVRFSLASQATPTTYVANAMRITTTLAHGIRTSAALVQNFGLTPSSPANNYFATGAIMKQHISLGPMSQPSPSILVYTDLASESGYSSATTFVAGLGDFREGADTRLRIALEANNVPSTLIVYGITHTI